MELATAPTGSLHDLTERLRAFDTDGFAELERGLHAMAGGDFTQVLEIPIELVETADDSPEVRALVDIVNAMLVRMRGAVTAYEGLRGELSDALGDQSCLPELSSALQSLNDHCLLDLDTGLQAMADGDFTLSAEPVTHPLRPHAGDALGTLGETFNEMLARSRTALRSYDAVREDLRQSLGDRSCLDDLRTGLRSLQRHCLRDLEEALESIVEDTALTRPIAPATRPIVPRGDGSAGELAALFNRALDRAQKSVQHLAIARETRLRPGA